MRRARRRGGKSRTALCASSGMFAGRGHILLLDLRGRFVERAHGRGKLLHDGLGRAPGRDGLAERAAEALDHALGLRRSFAGRPRLVVDAGQLGARRSILVVGAAGVNGLPAGDLDEASRAALVARGPERRAALGRSACPRGGGCGGVAPARQRLGRSIFFGPAQCGKFAGGRGAPEQRPVIGGRTHGVVPASTVNVPARASVLDRPCQRTVALPVQRPSGRSRPSASMKTQPAVTPTEV